MSSNNSPTKNTLVSLLDYKIAGKKDIPQAVCWHEGMLLSPQHFQQNHQYWEGQLTQVLAHLHPYFWGISELAIDHNDLLDGTITIRSLSAILPDGLLVNYSIKTDQPLVIDASDVSHEAVMLYLTVPIQVDGSASERSEIQRYSSRDGEAKKDENTGDNEMVITRISPKLSLQLTNTVGKRYISLPLFRVFKPDEGSLQIDPSYSPPLLMIKADNFRSESDSNLVGKALQLRVRALALNIRQKAKQIAGVTDKGDSLGRNVNDRHHRYIRAMVQELPSLELIADTEESTPYQLYSCLIRVAGSISELARNHIPPQFKKYLHIDSLPLIEEVMDYIKVQVSSVNLHYSTFSFDHERNGIFSLMVDKEWNGRDLIVELRPTKNNGREQITQWLKSCRIASANLHKDLSERRLLGARAETISSNESAGIIPAQGNTLFKITIDKRFIQVDKKLLVVSTSNKVKDYIPQTILVHIPHS